MALKALGELRQKLCNSIPKLAIGLLYKLRPGNSASLQIKSCGSLSNGTGDVVILMSDFDVK